MVFVAGAFDRFADARAAAEELRDSGFGGETVRVTTNPDNPDGTPGISVTDEVGKWPGILEMLVRNVFDLDEQHYLRRQQTEAIRHGGVVVSVPVHDRDEQSIARAVLYRHHAVELGSTPGGVPIH